jgi:hypothetical protein
VHEQGGIGQQQVGLHRLGQDTGVEGQLPGCGQRRRRRMPTGVLQAAECEQRLHPPRGEAVLGRHLDGAAQRRLGRVGVGSEAATSQYAQRFAVHRVACRRVVSRGTDLGVEALGSADRGLGERDGAADVSGAERGIGGQHRRPGIVRPSGALHEPLRGAPPAADHGGTSQPQAQLGVVVPAHGDRGQCGLADIDGLGRTTEQGQHPDAFDRDLPARLPGRGRA